MASVLIAGLSARAAADSAVAAGFAVTTVDAFGDLDLHPSVRAVSVPRDAGVPFSAMAAARAASAFSTDAVVYLANFENEPDAVAELAAGRTLWGNPPEVLSRVRDPLLLARTVRQHGLSAPSVFLRLNDSNVPNDSNDPNDSNVPNDSNDPNDPNDPNEWLLKPRSSGGGQRIHRWTGEPVRSGYYLQELIDGIPASIAFVAAGGVCVPLGISIQLVGEPAFAADGYRYCGNILVPAGDSVLAHEDAVVARASALASVIAASFDLVGLNTVDLIVGARETYPIEVNPRWSGSMELVERAYGMSCFAVHAAACADGELPSFELHHARRRHLAVGKAVLFARRDVTMGDTRAWLADPSVRDVPQPGERIAAGHPICTVIAEAADTAGCRVALIRRAEQVYADLEGS